jgi:2-dehydro-3-deoxyphosphogluconate aldolase/(4S)-4-hydroxy-2-oxoglutarate aldolase
MTGVSLQFEVPVVGILRGIEASFFREVMDVSFGAGLQFLEITMNTEGAAGIVRRCRPEVGGGKWLGMGTVRNLEEARLAVDAGAMFIVTPNTDPGVIEFCRAENVPVIAGAFTPTEVYRAWAAGAAMVKVFPCGVVGPGYIRELRGPFEQIPLVAVGGVNLSNLGDYFKAGAAGVGVSSALFGKDALARQDMKEISANVGEFVRVLMEIAG